ncbi:MAG TPA: fumarylacetoacetate hydrolase family protein [Candidatus Deferrimicrobium sp.]|nr:fumarylacetoacetate hydrolase family protein [Candidatus Deferrimicrobium sp.]
MNQRFVRFALSEGGASHYGLCEENRVTKLEKPPWLGLFATGDVFDRAEITLKAPVEPSKIICIGLNYHAHVAASLSADKPPEKPLIFLKPPSAIIGPNEKIIHPPQSERVDYEAELGLVIGRTARNVSIAEAEACLFGLTCVNDVTARDLQKVDGQWSRAKGFDTFCPVGPWVVTGVGWRDLLVQGVLNDEIKQSGRTSQMIFNVPYLISYVSAVMTLYPGDLIATGTPAGIAPMKPGDKIEVRIEQVGTLVNWMAR